MDATLRNQLLKVLENTYLYPPQSAIPALHLIGHFYGHYARISATDIAANNVKLREPYNPNEPLESLYMRINACNNYVKSAGNTITKGQIVQIMCGLISETGRFQEDCRNLQEKLYYGKTCMYFQSHSIEVQSDLIKRQQTSLQGGYSSNSSTHNAVVIQESFANLAQATTEYCDAIPNLEIVSLTLLDQVEIYANRLSTKEPDNKSLQFAVRNLQGEVNNIKVEIVTLKRSGHSGDASASNKKR